MVRIWWQSGLVPSYSNLNQHGHHVSAIAAAVMQVRNEMCIDCVDLAGVKSADERGKLRNNLKRHRRLCTCIPVP